MGLRIICVAAGGLVIGLCSLQAKAGDIVMDDVRSHARFQLQIPLRRTLDGRFPRVQSEWLAQTDGRWRVAVSLPADAAEIPGRPRYTRSMRSETFFNSRRHPRIQFLSDAFDTQFLARGGKLAGVLTMRGVARREAMQFAPSTCTPPKPQVCTIEVKGTVSRSAYGMTSLQGILGDAVLFDLRITHGAES